MEKLRKKYTAVSFHKTQRHPFTGNCDYDCIELFSRNRGPVAEVIKELEKSGWRKLFFQPFGAYWESKLVKKRED